MAALVFLTALPAVIPFLLFRDARLALRASNAVLIGLLLRRLALGRPHGGGPPRTGPFMTSPGVALVVVAIALGG